MSVEAALHEKAISLGRQNKQCLLACLQLLSTFDVAKDAGRVGRPDNRLPASRVFGASFGLQGQLICFSSIMGVQGRFAMRRLGRGAWAERDSKANLLVRKSPQLISPFVEGPVRPLPLYSTRRGLYIA